MYTDPGIWAMFIAVIVGFGLTPLYLFRTKIIDGIRRLFKKK